MFFASLQGLAISRIVKDLPSCFKKIVQLPIELKNLALKEISTSRLKSFLENIDQPQTEEKAELITLIAYELLSRKDAEALYFTLYQMLDKPMIEKLLLCKFDLNHCLKLLQDAFNSEHKIPLTKQLILYRQLELLKHYKVSSNISLADKSLEFSFLEAIEPNLHRLMLAKLELGVEPINSSNAETNTIGFLNDNYIPENPKAFLERFTIYAPLVTGSKKVDLMLLCILALQNGRVVKDEHLFKSFAEIYSQVPKEQQESIFKYAQRPIIHSIGSRLNLCRLIIELSRVSGVFDRFQLPNFTHLSFNNLEFSTVLLHLGVVTKKLDEGTILQKLEEIINKLMKMSIETLSQTKASLHALVALYKDLPEGIQEKFINKILTADLFNAPDCIYNQEAYAKLAVLTKGGLRQKLINKIWCTSAKFDIAEQVSQIKALTILSHAHLFDFNDANKVNYLFNMLKRREGVLFGEAIKFFATSIDNISKSMQASLVDIIKERVLEPKDINKHTFGLIVELVRTCPVVKEAPLIEIVQRTIKSKYPQDRAVGARAMAAIAMFSEREDVKDFVKNIYQANNSPINNELKMQLALRAQELGITIEVKNKEEKKEQKEQGIRCGCSA